MNKAQERRVEYLRKAIINEFDYSRGKGEYEYKRFEVNEQKHFVSVWAEVGLVGDENTYASIFGRNMVQIFIGKRGGMTYPSTNKRTGKWMERPVKSIFSVYYDQKYNR